MKPTKAIKALQSMHALGCITCARCGKKKIETKEIKSFSYCEMFAPIFFLLFFRYKKYA